MLLLLLLSMRASPALIQLVRRGARQIMQRQRPVVSPALRGLLRHQHRHSQLFPQQQLRSISTGDYEALHAESLKDPEGFWGRLAKDVVWDKPPPRVLDSSAAPFY